MTFVPQNNYSKHDLIDCANGDLFTKDGDGRLPSDEMLMFDEIKNIDAAIDKTTNKLIISLRFLMCMNYIICCYFYRRKIHSAKT